MSDEYFLNPFQARLFRLLDIEYFVRHAKLPLISAVFEIF